MQFLRCSTPPFLLVITFAAVAGLLNGARENPRQEVPPPTYADLRYGPHERNILDLWLADSETPTPLMIQIHGGGFRGGDKSRFRTPENILPYLEEGISVALINYRLTDGGKNPFPASVMDSARAIQFLRYNAGEFNLNKNRFGAGGGSAGACTSLWIGFHPDLAEPTSEDPVLRESSRLQVIASRGGQSSLHLPTLYDWFGVSTLTEHNAFRPLFGLPSDGEFELTPEILDTMRQASAITYLTPDDPPVHLVYGPRKPVDENASPGTWVHHPVMGDNLKKAMDAFGIECVLEVQGETGTRSPSQTEFVIRKLKDSPESE